MKTQKKRPVYFNYQIWVPVKDRKDPKDPKQRFKTIEGDGIFHQFGKDLEEMDEMFREQTIAIVEDESGKIHCIHPTKIQFKDK